MGTRSQVAPKNVRHKVAGGLLEYTDTIVAAIIEISLNGAGIITTDLEGDWSEVEYFTPVGEDDFGGVGQCF